MSIKFLKNSTKPSPDIRASLSLLLGDNLLINEPLSSFASAKVGGVAEYLAIVDDLSKLIEVVRLAYAHRVDYRLVGGGTAILPSDVGFGGLVIINRCTNIAFNPSDSCAVVSAGTPVNTLIHQAANRGLGGLEFMAAVPGTVAGAVITNVYTEGVRIGSFVKSATLLVEQDGEMQTVTVLGEQISSLRLWLSQGGALKYPPVILSVKLQMAKLPQDEIIRRLSLHSKKPHPQISLSGMVSHWFEPIEDDKLVKLRHAVKSQRIPNFLFNGLSLVANNKEKPTAKDFRDVIRRITSIAKELGIILEDRISYLGYWPEEAERDEKV